MAVAMLQMLPGATQDLYEQLNRQMWGQPRPPADQLPEGLIVHSAGPAENGWYVYDIWESREAFQRFMDEKLMPAAREVIGDQPMPQGSEPQFYEIESLAVAR